MLLIKSNKQYAVEADCVTDVTVNMHASMQHDVLHDNNIYCYHISYYASSYTTKYDADISRLVCVCVCVRMCFSSLRILVTPMCQAFCKNFRTV